MKHPSFANVFAYLTLVFGCIAIEKYIRTFGSGELNNGRVNPCAC
jgi:hypothetical protein